MEFCTSPGPVALGKGKTVVVRSNVQKWQGPKKYNKEKRHADGKASSRVEVNQEACVVGVEQASSCSSRYGKVQIPGMAFARAPPIYFA